MHSVELENQLIIVDIVDALQDFVSIQIDIDETKVKAAEIVAQKIDIQRVIGKANVQRCLDLNNQADEDLKALVVPVLCYFTYSRLLKMFPGTFTDGGLVIDADAEDRNVAKSTAAYHASIAESFMIDVTDFLEAETPNDEDVDATKINPRIRVFGGRELRASN